MVNQQSYQGIERPASPDWLGWFILDLLDENPNETEEHIAEIKQLLDFEVKLFFYCLNYKLPADTGL